MEIRGFWAEVRKCSNKKKNNKYPNIVDGTQGKHEIAGMLASKFEDLYNCVGYDDEEMMKLKNDIKKAIQRCNKQVKLIKEGWCN